MKKDPVKKLLADYEVFLERNHLYVIVFILAFLLCVLASHPQFLINDEWITGNQLAQLDQGHQFLTNEGKYGMHPNGTYYSYFQSRNNALGYPIFLPIISLPTMKVLKIVGDNFDYWLITVWSLLLVFLGLLTQKFYHGIRLFKRIPLSSCLIVLAFLIFIVNMILYQPFTILPNDAPREAAALIFTNNLLFAGVAVIIFSTIYTIFQDRWYSLFGTLVCVASSSYLIWTSSAKDHSLEIFLFSIVVFGVVKFLYTKKFRYCYLSFLFIGLLAWDRPEIGIVLMVFLFISLIPFTIMQWKITKTKRNIIFWFISPLFSAIGAIPLFINNYIVTKNPLITTYSVWGLGVNNISAVESQATQIIPHSIVANFGSIFQEIFLQIHPDFATFPNDLFGILFFPEIGTTGVLILVPLFIVGLISIPWLLRNKPALFTIDELLLLIPLILVTLAMFVIYLSTFHILNTNPGIAPDVRYLSPIYFPLNLIALIILSKFPNIIPSTKVVIGYFVGFTALFLPLFILLISIEKHQIEDFYLVFFQVSEWLSLVVILGLVSSLFLPYLYLERQNKKPFIIILGLLISLPFVWQIVTTFMIANMANSYAGYTFWLPIIVHFNHLLYISI